MLDPPKDDNMKEIAKEIRSVSADPKTIVEFWDKAIGS